MSHRMFSLYYLIVGGALFITVPSLAQSSHQGKVVAVGDGKLTMTTMAGENQHTHDVATDAAITCEGKTCGLGELKAGDAITVTLDKKGDKMVVTKIEAKKAGS